MVPTYLVEHVALLGCVVVDWLAHIGVQLLWLVVRHNDVLEESRGRIMVGWFAQTQVITKLVACKECDGGKQVVTCLQTNTTAPEQARLDFSHPHKDRIRPK